MSKPPTLADAVIKTFSSSKFRSVIDPKGWVAKTVAQARKFVLDDNMSAFMSDLSYASIPKTTSEKRIYEIIDGQRLLSRPPHSLVWVEYNMKLRAERAKTYGAHILGFKGPDRCGWLMFSLPESPHCFQALPFSSQSISDFSPAATMIDRPNASPLCYAWTCENDPSHMAFFYAKNEAMHDHGKELASQMLVGHKAYRNHDTFGITVPPYATEAMMNAFINSNHLDTFFTEQAGDVRALWAFLACINDVPTIRETIAPGKGQMVGKNYKRFVEHTVIKLNVPSRVTLRQLAQRVTRASRRRAHQVRGHWRIDWRAIPTTLCEHVWAPDHEQHLRCTSCKGRKLWIDEHQRGDASLGFVLHDYAVTHE